MDPPEQTRLRKLVSKGFTPRRVAGTRAADPADHRPLPRPVPVLGRASTGSADFAGKLPMDVISEMLGVPEADRDEVRRLADLLVHREPGLRDVPAAGIEAAMTLFGYYADLLAEQRAAAGRRPDQRAARRRGRRRPDDRRGDHRVPVPDGRGRQRDHHQAARQRGLPPHRRPGAARPGLRRPRRHRIGRRWVEETLRYDTSTQLLARLLDAGPHPARRHCSRGVEAAVPASARPTATSACSPTRTRFDLDRDSASSRRSLSFGGGRHFCLGANLARLEARVALRELVRRVRSDRGRPREGGAVLLRQRPRLRAAAGDGGGALMGKYDQPARRPAVVTGASSGIGAATALALAAAGHPGGARRAPHRPVRGGRRPDPGRRRRGRRARPRPARPGSVDGVRRRRRRRPRRRRGGRLQRGCGRHLA